VFGISGFELFIIGVLALILLGPDRLPTYARKAGRLWADFKRYQATMESVLRSEIDLGMKESDGEHAASASSPAEAFVADEEDEEEE
jgi:sec-independent protein translocase protein TatB